MRTIQSSFNAGKFSPLLEGRTDLSKYGSALYKSTNFLLDPRGPATLRPGFRYIAETKTSSSQSYLLPFEFSITQAYILEFGDEYIRFYREQDQILDGATPYEVVSPYAEADLSGIKYTQSADVLYLFHPDYATRKLSRTGHTTWTLSQINFDPPAISEQGIQPAATLTPGATTGAAVTFTAGSGVFISGDVGRVISYGAGRASIVTFTSSTVVECDIIDDFPDTDPIASGEWTLNGSTNDTVTPSSKSPVGRVINLTASTDDVWRTSDIGKYVRINSGLVRITSRTSATVAKGEILKVLSSTSGSTIWTIEDDVWNSSNGYPSCGTFFEDRLVLAGSTAYPETVWGSVVGDYENFTPGVDDSDSFEFTLAGRQVQLIRWLEPREYLLVGTVSGEWRLGPEDTGDPLTPLNVTAKEERNHGSANISPATVTGSTLFVQRAGRKVREFSYNFADDGYNAPDLTLLAEDITKGGIAGMVYQQEPMSILWCWLEDGSLTSLSYLREQEVIGWGQHDTGGEVESMAVIPGDGYDEVWAIIKRTIDGSTVRYVEMMEEIFRDSASTYENNKGLNAFFVDAGYTYTGAATTTITGLDHLEGESVAVLADGAVVSGKTVSSGQITVPSSTVVHVGLFNDATLQMMRLDMQLQGGTIQGRYKSINDLIVRVINSGGFKAGPDESNLDSIYNREADIVLSGAYPLYTGDLEIGYDAGWEKDARPMIVQDKPLPLTVIAIMADLEL